MLTSADWAALRRALRAHSLCDQPEDALRNALRARPLYCPASTLRKALRALSLYRPLGTLCGRRFAQLVVWCTFAPPYGRPWQDTYSQRVRSA